MSKKLFTISALYSVLFLITHSLQASPHGNKEDFEEERTSWIKNRNQEIDSEELDFTKGIKRPTPNLFN